MRTQKNILIIIEKDTKSIIIIYELLIKITFQS